MHVVSAKGLVTLLLVPLAAATLQFLGPSQVSLESIRRVLEIIRLALARATFRVTRSRISWSAPILLSVADLLASVQLGSRQRVGQLPRQRPALFLIIRFLAWARLNLVTIVLRPGASQQELASSSMWFLPSRQSCSRFSLLIRSFVLEKLRVGLPTISRL